QRRAEREVQDMLRRHLVRAEDEHEERHHHHAAADTEQASSETDERSNAEVGRPLHQACSRCSTSSAKPAPAAAWVTNLGGVLTRAAKRLMLATPTEFGKNSNIGASFGESPTYTTVAPPSSSMPNCWRKSSRVIVSLSYSPNQPFT